MACIGLISVNINAQSQNWWRVNGNTPSSSDFLGTSNSSDLIFKTNNQTRFVIDAAGNFKVNALAGAGKQLLFSDNSGKIIAIAMGTANQFLDGTGIWKNIPVSANSFTLNGNQLYTAPGTLFGIGTNNPQYSLDVAGNARVQNNLIVGGGVIITDKVHAAITVTASTLRADSLMLNSTKGIYGTTNINGDVFANNKLTVSGNAVFGGVLTANQGLGLGNNNGLKIITSSNPGIGNILAIGTGVATLPSGGAINDPAPCVVSSIIGSPSSWMYNTSQGYYNKVSSGTNSAYYSQYINPGTGNSYIDVSGSINGSTPAALYINQNCTASTYINQSGGNVYAGDNVFLNSNVTIGTTPSYAGSVKVYGQQTFYGANSNQSVCRVLNAASPAFNIIANGNVKIGNIQTPGNSSDAMLSIGQSSKTNLALSLVDNTNPMAPVPFFNVLGDGTTTLFTNYATNSGKSLVAVKNNNITGTQAWSSNVFEVQADGKTFIGSQRQNAGNHTNAMLNIYGKTVSTEVVVTQQNWADYVFANNYQLKSLNEVEQYIKEHKHLPNVPSQQEIQNEGLNLGEINKVQMEKIEELTLYIIALKKELDELKKEVRKK